MNKNAFILAMAEYMGKSKKETAEFVDAFEAVLLKTLKAGDKIQLTGFGSFEVKERPEREGINPATKEKIKIAASKTVVFKAGKSLKENLEK